MEAQFIDIINKKISQTLTPLLAGKKCVLLDVPYYPNIGDTLIWEGTRLFLKQINAKCLYSASKNTFKFPSIEKDIVILLQGGGNFGDIWPEHQDFRSKVISNYVENQIIILPQSVYFANNETMIADANILAKHKNLTIIGRDLVSFNILKTYYHRNNILLLPDMAFCIGKINIYKQKTGKTLFLRRNDKETNTSVGDTFYSIIPEDAEVLDWPTMSTLSPSITWRIKISLSAKLTSIDWQWNNVIRPYYIEIGKKFISKYDTIYTTRLHGAILSILEGKDVTIFDNNYGKIHNFYNTWLINTPNVHVTKQ